MSRHLASLGAACLVLAFTFTGNAAAQGTLSSADIADALRRARAAAEAGQSEEAIRLVNPVIAQFPGHRQATAIKIEAEIASHDRNAALMTYERYVKAGEPEDASLLAPIARATLVDMASNHDDPMSIPALEALAAAGDKTARATLLAPAARFAGRPVPPEVRARLGDAAALADVKELADQGPASSRGAAIRTLKELGASAGVGPVLRRALGDPDVLVRLTAADAIGALRLREAEPELTAALRDRTLLLRILAASALKAIGETAGDQVLRDGLRSPLPDARLAAARALADDPRETGWVDVVRPILDTQDGLYRFEAAELLLDVDRPAAIQVLVKGLTDPNLSVRGETARILAANSDTDVGVLRVSLRDGAPWPRLYSAGAILNRAAHEPRGAGSTRPPGR